MSFRIIFFAAVSLCGPFAHSEEIFHIGTPDHSYSEFARERMPGRPVVYRVGESSPAKDWYSYQPGSLDDAVFRSTMEHDWVNPDPGTTGRLTGDPRPVPFRVVFTLSKPPKGGFKLRLDAIFRYRRPAAPRLAVDINGVSGVFALKPKPAPELWWPTGGEGGGGLQFVGYESLEAPLPSSAFREGANTLTLRCLDGFGIYYDDLSLSTNPDSVEDRIAAAGLDSTVLYKNGASGLVEVAKVWLRTTQPVGRARVHVQVGNSGLQTDLEQSDFGDVEATVEVPAFDIPQPASIWISGMAKPIFRGTFTPRRRWRVYALPFEQADFGYNDVPARTLEWENRFIDKTLEIQRQYPSYSFTLDAAANLEAYLASRDERHGRELLDHLRRGKWGINALYANSFTGLATPEELFRMLEFALEAGRRFGLAVDAASQTDEPSVTWALPQILAECGIKYFSDGSDPIRAPLNPIGLLNFRSPFYWQAPNGAKVLVWSAVSYTAVDDMTWAGWNAAAAHSGKYAPSLFGLEHSLPLFLSQYERDDSPFDAVLLYGLHNDEIPMRQYGGADIFDLWNSTYVFPKIVPATQRDFFSYITERFGSQIKTLRGDGGAYWEDEAGADARILSTIRSSQTQLLAAEKFESIANWLKPLLRLDQRAFGDAWKNLLLANSYVWSDANSFRQPYSYRTRHGEAAHRALAEAASQQSWDLRLQAIDKIAELVRTDKLGAVVLNSESWQRSGFFDFELQPDEVLTDPASRKPIPCGSTRSLNGYQDVQCWAQDVPPLGYKFYAIEEGHVPAGIPVPLSTPGTAIEGKYYRAELNARTGAIAHLTDKSSGRDLVRPESPYRLNEYLYVTGGDPGTVIQGSLNDNRLLAADATLPVPQLTVHRAELIEPPRAERFPWGTVVILHSKAENTPEVVSTVTLNDMQKEVLIRNEVTKTTTLKKEAVYFAFPFAVEHPEVEYQGATAWVNPESDMLPGANRQWFATQGGVRVHGPKHSVAWTSTDAALITLEDINRGLWPASIRIRNGTVFSYAMNNYWYTDTPAQQGGRFTFRYSVTSGADISLAEASRLSAEKRSPLVAIRRLVMGWEPRLPESGAAFLTSSPPGVAVLTIRPVIEGSGYMVRVHNALPEAVTARLEFPLCEIQEAWRGSARGDRTGSVKWTLHSVELPMAPSDVKTVVVRVNHEVP